MLVQSQERKEKGQKERKIEVNEHAHTLHSFFSPPTDIRIYTKVVHTTMSPTCMIKPKQSIYQQKPKPKYLKNKSSESDIDRRQSSPHVFLALEQKIEGSTTTRVLKYGTDEHIYIDLDIKCRYVYH